MSTTQKAAATEDLDRIATALNLSLRRDLNDIRTDSHRPPTMDDPSDPNTDTTIGIIDIKTKMLHDAEAAKHARVNAKGERLCVDCDEPIPAKRIQALPYAKRCVGCESARENAPVRRKAAPRSY